MFIWDEIEGVMVYEFVYVKNCDIFIMIIMVIIVGVIGMLVNFVFFFGGNWNSVGGIIGMIVIMILVFMVVGFV